MQHLTKAKKAVVKVGDGRGFIIDTDPPMIVTAAHCLPKLPPAHAASYTEERTYPDLIGSVDEPEPKIWAECLFVDPVADIAVLGEPDGQELYDQNDAYLEFVAKASSLACGKSPKRRAYPMKAILEEQAQLLGLDGTWESCVIVSLRSGSLWIKEAVNGILEGMSGSPIVNTSGEAVGVVSTSGGIGEAVLHTEGGPQASLQYHLPGWLLVEIKQLDKPDSRTAPAVKRGHENKRR